MGIESKHFWNSFSANTQRIMSHIPRWVQIVGIVGLLLSGVALIGILVYARDASIVSGDASVDYNSYLSIIKSYAWGYVFIAILVISTLLLIGPFIYSSFQGFLETCFTRKTKSLSVSELQAANNPSDSENKAKLPIKDRINNLKPFIVDCFWGGAMWSGEEYHVRDFEKSLERLLHKERGNIMRLGHLAWLLWEYGWTKEIYDSFQEWIITFFSALSLPKPKETSPNKYSGKIVNDSNQSAYAETDNNFSYLMNENYLKYLKTQSRLPHKID